MREIKIKTQVKSGLISIKTNARTKRELLEIIEKDYESYGLSNPYQLKNVKLVDYQTEVTFESDDSVLPSIDCLLLAIPEKTHLGGDDCDDCSDYDNNSGEEKDYYYKINRAKSEVLKEINKDFDSLDPIHKKYKNIEDYNFIKYPQNKEDIIRNLDTSELAIYTIKNMMNSYRFNLNNLFSMIDSVMFDYIDSVLLEETSEIKNKISDAVKNNQKIGGNVVMIEVPYDIEDYEASTELLIKIEDYISEVLYCIHTDLELIKYIRNRILFDSANKHDSLLEAEEPNTKEESVTDESNDTKEENITPTVSEEVNNLVSEIKDKLSKLENIVNKSNDAQDFVIATKEEIEEKYNKLMNFFNSK